MRLAWKIFGASALVIAVLVGVAGWSLGAMARLVTANRDIATRSAPAATKPVRARAIACKPPKSRISPAN